ncbi:MAG: hypothetical protein H6673_02965 [Anaerolineales bacterium]|nr:hypothetical protein [Anaerolineales bacterium]
MTTPETLEENLNEPQAESEEKGKKDRSAQFYIIMVLLGSIGLCLVLFLFAVGVAAVSGEWENVAHFVAIVRDLFLILLVLQGIMISVALILLVLQVSALTNILKNELRPIVDSTQQAADTAKGTALFVGKHAVGPLVQTKAVVTGSRAFIREMLAIQRAVHPKEKGEDGEEETTESVSTEWDDLGDADGGFGGVVESSP